MRDDCLQVDELLLQLADYKNDYADVAAAKLLKKCSTSWEAYRYLKDRANRSKSGPAFSKYARFIILRLPGLRRTYKP